MSVILPKINQTGEPTFKAACMGNPSGDETNSSMIRVYDAAGNVIETHEQAGDFKEW